MKLQINLENELWEEKRVLVTPKELLLINEFDRHEKFVTNDALERIGINHNLKVGEKIKNTLFKKLDETVRFNNEKVFHISQIEKICKKYDLRFLPSSIYKGVIDEHLPNKIATFEIAYNVICDKTNTMIVAPKESFVLQERPLDPLLFFKINEEYYYLIHKWGNDLSITRAIKPALIKFVLSVFFIPAAIILGFSYGVLYSIMTQSFIVASCGIFIILFGLTSSFVKAVISERIGDGFSDIWKSDIRFK